MAEVGGTQHLKKRKAAIGELEKGLQSLSEEDVIQAQLHFKNVIKKFAPFTDLVRTATRFLDMTEAHETPELELITAEDHFHYGVHLMNHNRQQDAKAAFQKAIELDPEDADSLYNLACIAALEGDKAAMMERVRKALALKPELLSSVIEDGELTALITHEDFKSLKEVIELVAEKAEIEALKIEKAARKAAKAAVKAAVKSEEHSQADSAGAPEPPEPEPVAEEKAPVAEKPAKKKTATTTNTTKSAGADKRAGKTVVKSHAEEEIPVEPDVASEEIPDGAV
ncbi:tetratricopeptide repeat protein [bacterium]|nr:tetratricopeptide repeat protein [candidate division CSSED10-310 bacterium]